MASVIQSLGTPRRREILRLVWEGERSAGEIHRALGDVTFGAVSQHLRRLAGAARRRSRGGGGARSAGEIHRALGDVTFGAVSQHLRRLEEASLLRSRREGRHRFYAARKD